MSSSYVERLLTSFAYDPQVDGYTTGVFWNTVAGTPAVTSNLLVFEPAEEAASLASITEHVDIEFVLTVASAPASGDARLWGLRNPSMGNRGAAYFEIAGAVFRVRLYAEDGTTLLLDKEITWDAAWNNTPTRFRVQIGQAGARFWINDVLQPLCVVDNLLATMPKIPLRVDIKNGTGSAGNLSLSSLMVRYAATLS